MFGMNQNYPQYMQPFTNKLVVNSKEEAINRTSQLNSVMLYVIQPSGNLIEVAVDQFGNKSTREFRTIPIEEQVQQDNMFENRLKTLEEKIDKLIGGQKDEQPQ